MVGSLSFHFRHCHMNRLEGLHVTEIGPTCCLIDFRKARRDITHRFVSLVSLMFPFASGWIH